MSDGSKQEAWAAEPVFIEETFDVPVNIQLISVSCEV